LYEKHQHQDRKDYRNSDRKLLDCYETLNI